MIKQKSVLHAALFGEQWNSSYCSCLLHFPHGLCLGAPLFMALEMRVSIASGLLSLGPLNGALQNRPSLLFSPLQPSQKVITRCRRLSWMEWNVLLQRTAHAEYLCIQTIFILSLLIWVKLKTSFSSLGRPTAESFETPNLYAKCTLKSKQ